MGGRGPRGARRGDDGCRQRRGYRPAPGRSSHSARYPAQRARERVHRACRAARRRVRCIGRLLRRRAPSLGAPPGSGGSISRVASADSASSPRAPVVAPALAPRLLKRFCAGAWGWSDHWVARESLAAARRRGGATAAHACRLGPVRVSRGAVRQSSGTIWCSALARDGRRRKSRVIAPRIALLQHASLNILQLANTRLSWRLVHGHEGSLRLERSMCSARPRSVCRGPRQGLQSSAPMRRRSKAEE
jgi:hypothetical protein